MALPRRTLLGGFLAGLSGVAGCPSSRETDPTSENTPTEEPPLAAQFDCAAADRPAPDVEAGVEHEIELEAIGTG